MLKPNAPDTKIVIVAAKNSQTYVELLHLLNQSKNKKSRIPKVWRDVRPIGRWVAKPW